jgi:nucleoside-diphosphate-sugar epimerase
MAQELHVIFGTGPLGQSVMRALLERGKSVRMINRSGKRPVDAPAQVEIRAGDAFDENFTRSAAQGAAVVYQCAQPPYWEWLTKFIPLQTAILEGAANAGAKLVVGDNLYMYGEVNGPIHEKLPYAAATRKGKLRAEAARQLQAAHQSGKARVAVGRGSDFFGPGVRESSAGERMFLPAVQGKAAEGLGNIDLPHTYTYISDFGKALAVLGESEAAFGQTWHVPNPATVSTRQFMQILFEELGQPAKVTSMGRLMLSIGGIFIPGARETVEMMYEFERPFVVQSDKFTRTFGMEATPLRDAIRATIAWYKTLV